MTHEPDEVDCGDVLEAVHLYLDGELDADSLDHIRQHLDDCSPCLREYGIEREVKILIARSCAEVAPDSLRLSVVDRIRIVRSEMTQVEFRSD
ncbi:MAG TPA: mycothiol system anti-sigma-R factor [Actinomycetes bacterium]|nr:mycothiol system anti-sigma-R factor [Actinomycetes bacterium]